MGAYFVIHAPRQTGKTTAIRTLAEALTGVNGSRPARQCNAPRPGLLRACSSAQLVVRPTLGVVDPARTIVIGMSARSRILFVVTMVREVEDVVRIISALRGGAEPSSRPSSRPGGRASGRPARGP